MVLFIATESLPVLQQQKNQFSGEGFNPHDEYGKTASSLPSNRDAVELRMLGREDAILS